MVLDVKRAFLYGKARRPIYLRLPPEDPQAKGGKVLGRLLRSMYGTRDAPQIWQEELRATLQQMGFQMCLSHPGVYVHLDLNVRAVAHVDDVMLTGPKKALLEVRAHLEKSYELVE